jgi:hypothetical protein
MAYPYVSDREVAVLSKHFGDPRPAASTRTWSAAATRR